MMNRKNRIILYVLAAGVFMMTSCREKKHFDIELIVGKWVAGTEYYRYDNDGKGATWDVADDVNEDEAQPFEWEFDEESNHLTLIHQMEMGGVIPKSYTLKTLDDKVLAYTDKYDSTYTYKRVI